MASKFDELHARWDALTPGTRRYVGWGLGAIAVLLGAVVVSQFMGPPKKVLTADAKKTEATVLNPTAPDNSAESMLALIKGLQGQIAQLQNGQVTLAGQVNSTNTTLTGRVNELSTGQRMDEIISKRVEAVAQSVVDDAIKKGRITATTPSRADSLGASSTAPQAPPGTTLNPTVVDLNAPLPLGAGNTGNGATGTPAGGGGALRVVEPQAPSTKGTDGQVTGAGLDGATTGGQASVTPRGAAPRLTPAANATARDQRDGKTNVEPGVFIPAGSILRGVLLSGLDAPTSGAALKQPTPALIRVKREAILPNYFKADLRECFILASGHGQMSTERAYMRTEMLTCVREDGGAVEVKLNGYLVGEDGKVGMRGRLVSKQGAIMAKAMVAGVLSGIGKALQPTSIIPVNNSATSGTLGTQFPDPTTILEGGAASGVSSALTQVSKFYLDAAKEMFPVVEIDAGRTVEIIITNGASIKFAGRG